MAEIDAIQAYDRGGIRLRPRRGLLIGAAVALAGVLAWQGETGYALAASAFQAISDAYLIQWIERAGMALGCF